MVKRAVENVLGRKGTTSVPTLGAISSLFIFEEVKGGPPRD